MQGNVWKTGSGPIPGENQDQAGMVAEVALWNEGGAFHPGGVPQSDVGDVLSAKSVRGKSPSPVMRQALAIGRRQLPRLSP